MSKPNHESVRIHELEDKVAQLTSLVEHLAPSASSGTTAVTSAEAEVAPATTSSRRGMLKLAGAAAAGAVAVAVGGNVTQVAALDGAPINAGQTTSTTPASRETTDLVYENSLVPLVAGFLPLSTVNANIFTIRDQPSGISLGDPSNSGFPAAIGGYSYRTVANGVYGFTATTGAGVVGVGSGAIASGVFGTVQSAAATGSGVFGKSDATAIGVSAGVRARSEKGPALLLEATATGIPTTGTWAAGAIVPDTTGNLWYCTVGGTPGTWKNLVPQPIVFPTAGTFTGVVPTRVYDSREALPSQGLLATGTSRTLSIKDGRAIAGGAVTLPDLVPNGAKAITANVTVVNTVSAGFLAVNPGGNTTVSAATVNWFSSGQILNNGVNITINPVNREVTVIAGGGTGAATDFVIDVTGYIL